MDRNPLHHLQIILALALVFVSPGCDPRPGDSGCGARNIACCAGGYCATGLLCNGETCVDDPSQSSDAGSMVQIPTADLLAPPDVATPSDLAISPDLTISPDLAMSPDLTMSLDLATPPDLAPTPDLAKLSPGQGCVTDNDCQSGFCSAGMCKMPTCIDGVKNGMETDVDCGGPCFMACPPGAGCRVNADCQDPVCTMKGCAIPTCNDGRKNGDETAVDCGGRICGACGLGLPCIIGDDCQSRMCTKNACAGSSCNDMLKNGLETDTDCGGPSCVKCQDGWLCQVDKDCLSGNCAGGLCMPATCMDGKRNGMETGIDCGGGGGKCPKCANGNPCLIDTDCMNGYCQADVCATATCMDHAKNGAETDIDCGGTCAKCADGKGCAGNMDCTSGACINGKCAAISCMDGIKNGMETDVDCGGPVCPRCTGVGKACNGMGDCQTAFCLGGSCQELYGPMVAYGTSGGPSGLAICDLDGDHKPDLAVAAFGSGFLNLFWNDLPGGFTRHQMDFRVENTKLACGDLNGDMVPDLTASKYYEAVPVTVFLNTAQIQNPRMAPLAAAVPYGALNSPYRTKIADFDNDGRADIVSAVGHDPGVIATLPGYGDGTFGAQTNWAAGGKDTYGLDVCDVNGDNKKDVVTVSADSGLASVFINNSTNGKISFLGAVTYSVLVGSIYIACANVDANAPPDLIIPVNNGQVTGIQVLSGMGNGTFGPPVNILSNTPSSVRGAAIGDVTGDGKADIFITNGGTNSVTLFASLPGNLQYQTTMISACPGQDDIVLGDLNGDTKLDLAMSCYSANQVGYSLHK